MYRGCLHKLPVVASQGPLPNNPHNIINDAAPCPHPQNDGSGCARRDHRVPVVTLRTTASRTLRLKCCGSPSDETKQIPPYLRDVRVAGVGWRLPVASDWDASVSGIPGIPGSSGVMVRAVTRAR